MKKILIVGAMALVMLCPVKAQIAWQQVEPGVWKGVVGTPEEYSLLGVAGVTPQRKVCPLTGGDITPISE